MGTGFHNALSGRILPGLAVHEQELVRLDPSRSSPDVERSVSTQGHSGDDIESQRKIEALVRGGGAMVSASDYEQALASLIETVGELLDSETGAFMLYDPERDELVLQRPAFGVTDERLVGEYHVPLSGGGNAVQVFLSRQPYRSNDLGRDPRMIRRFVDMFGARKAITVPLLIQGKPIGVFHAINKRHGNFTPGDVDLLCHLAPLLAVSIQSARMFREVREQRRQLERAIFLQKELSRTAFDAPGMQPLAHCLADLVSRPVMVLDSAMRPLASALWPDEQVLDDTWFHRPELSVREAGPCLKVSADGPVLVVIAVGSHFGGYLAILEGDAPLDLIDRGAIEHAAAIFALEMLREQSAYEVESRLKGGILHDLFSGSWSDEVEAAGLLQRVGYTFSGPCRVACVEAAERSGEERARSALWYQEMLGPESRLYAALTDTSRSLLGVAATAPWRSGFLVLMPAASEKAQETDVELASEFLSRAQREATAIRPGLRLRLALGSAVASAGTLEQSREESERAMYVARSLDVIDRPVFFEHLGVYRLLLGPNTGRDRRHFVEDALGVIRHHDAEHGSCLLETLRCWVASDYNSTEAARRLYVHINTLKYRLKRIRVLLGGDPSKGDLRFQVELALKVLDLPRLATAIDDRLRLADRE